MKLVDMKESLSSARKADTTHVRFAFEVYTSRPCEYGTAKGYERGNYRRPTGEGPHNTPTAEDFKRFASYLRAARDHISRTLDRMETHRAGDPRFEDIDGMRRAAYAVDTDVMPGSKEGPSLLPHVAPACSSLMMAIVQAADCGLLPADPGPSWAAGVLAPWAEPASLPPMSPPPPSLAPMERHEAAVAERAMRYGMGPERFVSVVASIATDLRNERFDGPAPAPGSATGAYDGQQYDGLGGVP